MSKFLVAGGIALIGFAIIVSYFFAAKIQLKCQQVWFAAFLNVVLTVFVAVVVENGLKFLSHIFAFSLSFIEVFVLFPFVYICFIAYFCAVKVNINF
jgi:hypothetical protein